MRALNVGTVIPAATPRGISGVRIVGGRKKKKEKEKTYDQ
jgi:hypothetical protein